MNRKSLIDRVWKETHADFKGKDDQGRRSVLHNGGAEGTVLVYLDTLDDLTLIEVADGKGVLKLSRKLSPVRFPRMSGKMAAMVGYIIGSMFTSPRIKDMAVTSDGFLLVQQEGDVGVGAPVGTGTSLRENWENLLDVADLTPEERDAAEMMYKKRVRRYDIPRG